MNRGIKLYNILRDRNFSKEEAESVVMEIESTVDQKFEDVKSTLRTRDHLNMVEKSIISEINSLGKSLRGDIHTSAISLKDENHRSTTTWVRWLVGLIIAQTAAIFFILRNIGVIGGGPGG